MLRKRIHYLTAFYAANYAGLTCSLTGLWPAKRFNFTSKLFRGQAVDEESQRRVEGHREARDELQDHRPEWGIKTFQSLAPIFSVWNRYDETFFDRN